MRTESCFATNYFLLAIRGLRLVALSSVGALVGTLGPTHTIQLRPSQKAGKNLPFDQNNPPFDDDFFPPLVTRLLTNTSRVTSQNADDRNA